MSTKPVWAFNLAFPETSHFCPSQLWQFTGEGGFPFIDYGNIIQSSKSRNPWSKPPIEPQDGIVALTKILSMDDQGLAAVFRRGNLEQKVENSWRFSFEGGGRGNWLILRRVGRGMKVFRCPEPQRETWLRVAGDLVRRMSAEVDSCKHRESSPSTPCGRCIWCRKQGVAKAAKWL